MLLCMLRLGVRHLLLIAVLVGKYDEQVAAVEVAFDFIGQVFQCVLVGNGALSGRHNNQQMVASNAGCQLRKGVPMWHFGIFGAHLWVAVADKFIDMRERVGASMELNAALQVASQAGQAFQPTVESGFKLGA